MDRDFPNRCDSGCRAFATQAVNPVLLQRKCACGQRSAEKECPECQSKNKPATAGINMAGNPQNYGHDFSRVHVRSEMEQGSSPSFASQRGMPRLESASEEVKKKQFFCPPAGDSITAISAAAGGGGTLGLTKIDSASQLLCFPKFKVDAKAGHCTFDPVAVSLSITSKFANPTPGSITSDKLPVPSCTNDVPVFFNADTKRWELCDDLTISFNQTLLPCSTELNKFAGTKIPGKSEDECFKSLKVKLGFDPGDCTLEFADLTKKDDERDSKGFHDFDPVLISKDCTKILSGVTPSATNKIGDPSVAPAKWIPASTKCPKAKAAAPSSSTSPAPVPSPTPGGNKPAPAPKSQKKEE